MNKSETVGKLAAALAKAFPQIGAAHKGASNPYFHANFADLKSVIDVVKEPLAAQGISVLQLVNADGDGNLLETVLLHESGEFISSAMRIVCAKQNDPQALGSAISYAKRYALQAALFVPSTDDDGEAAMSRPVKPQPKQEVPVNPEAPAKPAEEKRTWAGPNHKRLFEACIELDATDSEFIDAMKKAKLIPAAAKSFWAMSEATATKFTTGETWKEDIASVIEAFKGGK